MRKPIKWSMSFVVGLLCCVSPDDALAGVVTLDAANRGWITATSFNNGASPDNIFLAGICCGGLSEYRNWFQFDIPALPEGQIESAQLILDTAAVEFLQGPVMTYSVTSLPSVFGFADLGTGVAYGSRDYTAADVLTTQSIDLSGASLAEISASELGTFGIGGRISAGANFQSGSLSQFIFGSSVAGFVSRLEITINVVPEPSSLALALTLLCLLGRRK